MMPEPVLEEIRDEVMNWNGSGMSVMELSHRSPIFRTIVEDAESALRELMSIPNEYKVLFIQGGGTLQFAMVPWNLMKNGRAVYIDSGIWSKKAADEARKYGEVIIGASEAASNYIRIPDCSKMEIPSDADYVYICENETINGLTWRELPDTKGHPLVSDQSSMFLSEPRDVSKYAMIYAGVQKNVGPSGMVIAIMREDFIPKEVDPKMPVYLSYDTHAKTGSGYNTPNGWSIYCCGKVIHHLIKTGGLAAAAERNAEKAKIVYDFLESSKLFKSPVEPESRSVMNIPFVTGSKDLDAEVGAAAERAGLIGLKGHPSVGGLRASLYNAMPKEGAVALVDFLHSFEKEHGK